MLIKLPYGKDMLNINVPDKNYLYYAAPVKLGESPDADSVTLAAFENPIGTPCLEDMVKPGMKIALLIDDITRPTPKRFLLRYVLERLAKAKIPDSDIKLIVALGTHRKITCEEIDKHIGTDIVERFDFINIDYKDKSRFVDLGKTDSGIPVEVYREVVDADFKIAIGNIVPHIAAGWGGGAKMIQPGVCSEATTEITHLIACTKQKVMDACGSSDNLCRREMEDIAGRVGLDFIINTVLDEDKNIWGVFCGHYIEAHRAGIELAKKIMCPEIPKRADIVIASANPAQIDFWQGCKPYIFSQFGLREGGTLIFAMRGEEGLCGNAFHHEATLKKYGAMPYDEILKRVDNGEIKDIVGINVPLFISSMADRAETVMVSEGLDANAAAYLGFKWASGVEEALAEALAKHGADATVGIIPYAGETLVQITNGK